MLIDVEVINSKKYDRFEMIVKDYISLIKLQDELNVKAQYNVLINGFYETDEYIIQPYDKVCFIVNSATNRLQNFI